MVTRVALQVQGVVETYDDAGRLLKTEQTQVAMLAALSPTAAREACGALGEQLAALFAAAALAQGDGD